MPNNPLVVRFGALGDMVMLTPLLRMLAERSGEPCDVVGSGAWTKVLYANCPWVRDVYVIGSRKTPYLLSSEQKQLVTSLKERGNSPVWVLEEMPKVYRLLERAGYDLKQDAVDSLVDERHQDEHTIEHWQRLALKETVKTAWPPCSVTGTQLVVSEEERRECRAWLEKNGWQDRPIILIQPGNKKTMRAGARDRSSNVKFWPDERWVQVMRHMVLSNPDAVVLLCGAPPEQEYTESLAAQVQLPQVISVADQLPIRRLLAVMEMADCCVSVDTGPAHIAAAVGCPLLVLFGQTDPRLFCPRAETSPVLIAAQTSIEACAPGPEAWAAANTLEAVSAAQVIEQWESLYL